MLYSATASGQSALAQKSAIRPADRRLELGRAYGAHGQWSEAERELRTYRNGHPDSVEAIMLHAEALIQLSQPFDAALELQKFLESHPNSVRPLELHASLAANTLRDAPLATSELEKVTKLDPQNARAWKALAQMYLDREDMDGAMRALKQTERLAPNDAVVIASMAFADGQKDNSDRANSEFKRALQLANSSSRDAAVVRMLYGRFLLDSGRAADSIALFDATLKADPGYADGFYWRARAQQQLNNLEAAKADALQSIHLDPNQKQAALLLVSIYRKQGQSAEAQEYAEMVEHQAEVAEAQRAKGRQLRDNLNQAEHLLLQGSFAEAATRYESMLQSLPSYYEAYFGLGMCYAQMGRGAEAEAAFRKYLGFQPVSSDGRAALGILLLSQGRGAEAALELEQAIQIDPTLIEARKALAMEYLRESQPKSAIAILQSQSKVPDKDLQLMAAQAYLQSGQLPAALRSVERALVIAPGDPQSLEMKEQILAQQRESLPKAHSQIWIYGPELLLLTV
jgi:tetratricopeptide (TPR) repeat protein